MQLIRWTAAKRCRVNLSRRDALATLGALVACGIMRGARAEGSSMSVGQIARVFTGADGRSHIGEFTLSARDVRAGVAETEWLDALSVCSIRSIDPEADFKTQPRHVAPRRHLSVILAGTLELECSPEEARRFGPGSVVLLEDTTGEGHITHVVEAPVRFVQIALKS